MDDKTKNLLKVGGGALAYYWAARQSHSHTIKSRDIVQTVSGPELSSGAKFERGFRGVGKFLWGYIANEGLNGLGMSRDVALGWTIVGAAALEWYVLTYETHFAKVPAKLLAPPVVGWGHHGWEHHGWGEPEHHGWDEPEHHGWDEPEHHRHHHHEGWEGR